MDRDVTHKIVYGPKQSVGDRPVHKLPFGPKCRELFVILYFASINKSNFLSYKDS